MKIEEFVSQVLLTKQNRDDDYNEISNTIKNLEKLI